ncbi:dihydroneopterin aldolase [Deinococcus sp. VB343]|uniref:7,8-dihydroneopterin aldolase n=1 Tax=Deinococcus sp. VB142 TaxID=3112952 RepID=A0AAU6PZU7_9DEIO
MTKIVLQGLEFHAHHGVFATEGVLGARFVVDAELHYPFAGIADDLDEAVNYASAYAAIREEVTEKTHQLIEVLADRVADRLLNDFPRLERVRVRVHKPFAPLPGIFRDVCAELEKAQGEQPRGERAK